MLDDFAVDSLLRHVLSFQQGSNQVVQLLSNWCATAEISGMTRLQGRITYLLPACANHHWVLYEITPDAITLWDSIGSRLPKNMARLSQKVLEMVQVSRPDINEVQYSNDSEQQGASDSVLGNDCGLFVLNHARRVSRTETAIEKITRANGVPFLRAQWAADDEKWLGPRGGLPS